MKEENKIIITVLLGIIFVSSFVYALSLRQEFKVDVCYDSDKGINLTMRANAAYQNDTDYGFFDEYCENNTTLIEFSCDIRNNMTFFQIWEEDCECFEGKCVV